MRKFQKFIAILISVLLCFGVTVLPAYAAEKDDVSATYDEDTLYIHAEKSSGVYSWYGMAVYSLEIKSSGGDLWLQLQPGDGNTVTVRNQTGYIVIDGASGSYSYDSSGAGQWDIEIPLDALESHSAQTEIIVKMNWAGAGNVVKKAKPVESVPSSSQPDSSVSSSSASSGTVSDQPSDEDGIVIDGYYDDWDSVPYTIFTYHGNNDTTKHRVSVVKDNSSIYVHVKLSADYGKQIPIDNMRFKIDGKGWIRVSLRYTEDPYNLNGIYSLEPGRHGELSPYLDKGPKDQWQDLGDAYVTIPEEGNEDELEYRIDIETLEQAMNWEEGTVNNSGKITAEMPDLGYQHIVVTGTPTAPLVGVAVSVTAVVLVLVFRKYRRRKVQL